MRYPAPVQRWLIVAFLPLGAACSIDTAGLGGGSPATDAGPRCPDGRPVPEVGCSTSECTPTVPALEACDGVDNDCDPTTPDGADDPGVAIPCDGPDDDECAEGLVACVSGRLVCEDYTTNSHELCNGVDDDCDGTVDEDATDAQTWFVDADGDGHGVDGTGVTSCDAPPGRAMFAGDCDDTDPAVRPGATEICNLVDDDCDGTIDDASPTCGCVGHVYGSNIYLFCQTDVYWTTARDDCMSRSGRLVQIDSSAEHDFLVERVMFYRDVPWWIGLNDRASEDAWVWTDGSTPVFTAWHTDEPNDSGFPGEDCATMNVFTDRTWNDAPCDERYPYVCEVAGPL